jgi:arylsulfatase A-like enzyme
MRIRLAAILTFFTLTIPVPGQTRPRTPVILISIDTLRADHLSAYGYRRIQTPNIDSYAQNGTVVRNADAQIPLTLPSHTSLFTSTYPFENRIEENAEPVPPGTVTLASILKAQGYRTAAFLGCVFLEKEMGLDTGFDVYDSPFHFQAFSPLSGSVFLGDHPRGAVARDKRDGALVIRAAAQWLKTNRDQPAFAFLHLFDLHQPYGRSGYDEEIHYVDQLLGAFKKTLIDNGWWDRSLVILLSDHGEGLGEHGEDSHGYFIYQSTVRVPLLIHWPEPVKIAQQPVGLIDLAPTILEYLHIPAPPTFEGKSILKGDRPVFSESVHAYDSFGWSPLRSIRLGNFKYIEAPKPELYDLTKDPGELTNLAAKDPARAQTMRTQLLQFLAAHPPKSVPAATTTPQTQALLGSLGYLAAGPKTSGKGPAADPKDRLPEFHLYEKVQVALSEGRPTEAIALLKTILAKDPANPLARRDLGAAYLATKDYAKARDAFQQVLAISPGDYMTQFELGLADVQLGRLEEAQLHLEIACRIAPAAVQCRRELDAVKQKRK